eukprot:COSAG03_NODE_535_length_7104_cov_95.700500_1_plen_46_part_00
MQEREQPPLGGGGGGGGRRKENPAPLFYNKHTQGKTTTQKKEVFC